MRLREDDFSLLRNAMKLGVILFLWMFVGNFRVAAADVESNRFVLLSRLTPDKSMLPPGCSISEGRPPMEGLANRSITTDPRHFFLPDHGLTDMAKTNVQAMYLSAYREKGELGIFAWGFRTETGAKEAHAALLKRRDDVKLWLRGRTLVCLWRDIGTTDDCFKWFETFVAKQVQAVEPAPK
jgi:hypothetical protein